MLMYTLPLPRYEWYQYSNYQTIQDKVTAQTNQLMASLGFYDFRSMLELLQYMKLSQVASLMLGLLFGVIVVLFIVISVLLIYSLLMISVESKSFETSVLRLVGMSKVNCVAMILMQSVLFVLPSMVVGYGVSVPALLYIYKFMFKGAPDIHLSPVPSANATLEAIILGLLIPTVSSIVPIQVAMGKNLNEALSYQRSKTKGQKVEISSEESFERKLPYLITGFIASMSGMLIYYILPSSILNFNLGLLLEIFFFILIGMILGLTLISFNIQRVIELAVVHAVFWWERKSMKLLVVKNLSAHRESNKMTSIIYSLTLGCIIFIVVAANLQI